MPGIAATSKAAPAPRLRIEVFPASVKASLTFYITILRFTFSVPPKKNSPPPGEKKDGSDDYVHIKRGSIGIGLYPAPLPTAEQKGRYEQRATPVGTELVFVLPTLDDLHAEREWIVGKGWPLDADLALQDWGLWDFRVRDPDGYYWRITTERQPPRAD